MVNISQDRKKVNMTEQEIKEIATQLANVVIANAANKELTGEEKERKVCEFLATLDNSIPMASFIPDTLEAAILDAGIDAVQAFFEKVGVTQFVKKCYTRIKHLLHIG